MQFYTSVVQNKNKMFVRGIENGKPVKRIYDYSPYLFIPTTKETEFRTPTGQPVGKMEFDSIWDAREFAKQYENVEGMPIYGMTSYTYPFIFDHFRGEVKYDPSLISVTSLDIETKVGDEDIATAIQTTPNEVTAITISRSGRKTVFGCGDFVTDDPNITYLKCRDEQALLQTFLSVWNSSDYSPDVLTGWNVEFFDVPYLVGRIMKILGEEAVKRLSPWGLIRPYEVEIKGKKVTSYEMKGIAVLDYMALYKKFTYTNQESYRLDHIATVELGEKKLKIKDYNTVKMLYNTSDIKPDPKSNYNDLEEFERWAIIRNKILEEKKNRKI